MMKVACPLPLTAEDPCGAPSTVNVTLPVGVPPPEFAATVAVKVTLVPLVDGLRPETSWVVVSLFTT